MLSRSTPKTRQKLIKFCQRSLLSQELAKGLHLPLHMQSSFYVKMWFVRNVKYEHCQNDFKLAFSMYNCIQMKPHGSPFMT